MRHEKEQQAFKQSHCITSGFLWKSEYLVKLSFKLKRRKDKKSRALNGTPSQSYRASLNIRSHTVLPDTSEHTPS